MIITVINYFSDSSRSPSLLLAMISSSDSTTFEGTIGKGGQGGFLRLQRTSKGLVSNSGI